MKKLMFAALLGLIAISAGAQAQLETRKYKAADFRQRTMMVVLTGEDIFLDDALKESIENVWHISPYEFCSAADFEANKKNDKLYFLIPCDTKYHRDADAGIKTLMLFKGKATALAQMEGLPKLASVPLCSVNDPTGLDIAFIQPMVSILQKLTERMLEKELAGISVVAGPTKLSPRWREKIYISIDDFAVKPDETVKAAYARSGIFVVDDDAILTMASEKTPGVLLGHIVSPGRETVGNSYYAVVINSSSGDMLYVKKRRSSGMAPAGFNDRDLKFFISRKK